METQIILEFLTELQHNNKVAWMHANKAFYQDARAAFATLVQELIDGLGMFDAGVTELDPKDLIYRLNRDTRFSHNKAPYNPAFRAHISPAGRQPIPAGYYLHVQPGNCFLGGGLFTGCIPAATTIVRDYIVAHSRELKAVLATPAFAAEFELRGEKLKNVPRNYAKDHPMAEYLKHKSWYVAYPLPDVLFSDDIANIGFMLEKFSLMQPLNDYLNQALADFVMPKRPSR